MKELEEYCNNIGFQRYYAACELKPGDNFVWDDYKQLWLETDESFVKRVTNTLEKLDKS